MPERVIAASGYTQTSMQKSTLLLHTNSVCLWLLLAGPWQSDSLIICKYTTPKHNRLSIKTPLGQVQTKVEFVLNRRGVDMCADSIK